MVPSKVDIPPYKAPATTKYALDYAQLAIIDMTNFDRSPEDRAQLAHQLDDAVRDTGFWIVTGHGISDDEIDRHLDIGQAFFNTSLEEKSEYTSDLAHGM